MMKNDIFFIKLKELTRYGVVGFLNNLLGYFIYLLVTWLWVDPKIAVTLMYPLGALTAYFGHAKYSFVNTGSFSKYKIIRYTISHLIGYGVNIAILYIFSDRLGYPHQLCQAAAIIIVAGILFLLLRYFVFTNNTKLFCTLL